MKINALTKIGAVAVIAMMISACSMFDPNNGVRVKNNTEKQTIDPYAGFGEEIATLDGQKAEKLLDEYRTEKADAPDEKLLKDIGN